MLTNLHDDPVAEAEGLLDHTGLFHVAHHVADVEEAKAALSDRFGYTWAPSLHGTFLTWIGGTEPREIEWVKTLSVQGPVHVELGSSKDAVAHEGDLLVPQHFGYWCDDIASTKERLLAKGWTLDYEIEAGLQQRVPMLCSPSGFRIELCPPEGKPMIEAWKNGGLPV